MGWMRPFMRAQGSRTVKARRKRKRPRPLPTYLEPLFWDVNFKKVSWERHRDYVIGRILSHGTLRALYWLHKRVNDDELRDWHLRHEGRGLSTKQIRYWQLALGLPDEKVRQWLARPGHVLWANRARA